MTRTKTKSHSLTWRGTLLEIRHTRDYLIKGTDHVEVIVRKPKRAVLPITETGYRSHFLDPEELATDGGPVPFVQAWLEREAATKAWRARETKLAQLDFLHLLTQPPKPKAKRATRARVTA